MKILSEKYRFGFFLPIQTLIFLGFTYLVWVMFGAAPELLIYDRELIIQGEIWRLVTAHFVHIDREHLILNLSALLILGTLLENLQAKLLILSLLLGILAISLGLWFGMESLLFYCGLSGLLNGLFVVVIWEFWHISKDPIILCLGAANLIKIALEMTKNDALFSSIAWPVLPEAHFFGVLGGVCSLIFISLLKQKINKKLYLIKFHLIKY